MSNLQKEQKLRSVANPLSEYRKEYIKNVVKFEDIDLFETDNTEKSPNVKATENESSNTDKPLNENKKANETTNIEQNVEDLLEKCASLSISSNDLVCDICDAKLKKTGFLKLHKEKKHNLTSAFNCDFCEETFKTVKQIKRHVDTVHNFECEDCGEKFTSKNIFTNHIVVHLKCDICHKGFDKKWKLTKHMKSHNV